MKRVYHPTLNSWQDVPDDAVKDWTDAGWKATRPKHVDDSEALPPGQGYRAPSVHMSTNPVEPQAPPAASQPKGK